MIHYFALCYLCHRITRFLARDSESVAQCERCGALEPRFR